MGNFDIARSYEVMPSQPSILPAVSTYGECSTETKAAKDLLFSFRNICHICFFSVIVLKLYGEYFSNIVLALWAYVTVLLMNSEIQTRFIALFSGIRIFISKTHTTWNSVDIFLDRIQLEISRSFSWENICMLFVLCFEIESQTTSSEVCNMCLESYTHVGILSCSHTFCANCTARWCNTFTNCPFCHPEINENSKWRNGSMDLFIQFY
ncbi:Transmembrane protein 118 [Schistosoma japonicum]|nr:Transmembrane protein 118 [Schistosoma japonicum]